MAKTKEVTLFVADDADLDACFPGWRMPLAELRKYEFYNPFFQGMSTGQTFDPGRRPELGPPASLGSKRRRRAVPPIVPPDNDEAEFREKSVPPLLMTFPHTAMYGVSYWPLRELLTVLGVPEAPPARFVDCPEEEGTIEALPEGAVGAIASLDDREAKKALAAWQKALGLRGKSAKFIEDEAAEGSAWGLRRIRALAAEAVGRGAHLFVHLLM